MVEDSHSAISVAAISGTKSTPSSGSNPPKQSPENMSNQLMRDKTNVRRGGNGIVPLYSAAQDDQSSQITLEMLVQPPV